MNRAIAWFAENRVAANLLMAVMMVGGLSALPLIPQKTFPDIDIDIVTISVEYLGAAPEEVEEGVCVRVEEEIDGVDGIDTIRTTANEGMCSVVAELISGADAARVLDDVKSRVDALTTLPAETEKPIVSQLTLRRSVMDVAISGSVGERSLRALAERVRDELTALPGITQAEVAFARPFEISIEVPEESLRRHGLRFDDIVAAVRRSSLDLPGGSIKTEGGEILLRTKSQAYTGREFERIVVLTRTDGTRVTVGEIATVIDGFEDNDVSGRFDGTPAMLVHVFRVGDQDVIDISNRVKRYVAEAQTHVPPGVALTIWQDDSKALRGRLDTLLRNGRSGFLLVLAVLALFLRPRLALWVTAGVPVSFLGTLALFGAFDLSIDAMAMFAFLVVLGILVDDAIVVGENVHTQQQRLGDRLRGAVAGTQEVAVPVIFGVLTTVAAFAPLLMVEGPMGQVFAVLATVVILCLIASLVESQLVLPAHLSHGREKPARELKNPHLRRWKRIQDWFGGALERAASERYLPFLRRALEWRYATVAVALAALLVTAGYLASGRKPFSFFPPVEADFVTARLTMPRGTPIAVTAEAVAQIEGSVDSLRADLDPRYAPPGESLVRHVLTGVGTQPYRERMNNSPAGGRGEAAVGAHLGEVVLELVPSEEREISTREIAQRWRELVGDVPDAVELVFSSDLFSAGNAINIQLEGNDIDELRSAARRVEAELAAYPGVTDIADTFRAGKREVVLSLRPSAEPLGITSQLLARQVRQAFYGEEAQRIQRGRDDVRVMVRYPERQRRTLGDLENLRIRTPGGAEVPFATVASASLGRGFAAIRRSDRHRVVNVIADVDRRRTTENKVIGDLAATKLPQILADHPSVSYRLEGTQREQQRAGTALLRGLFLALCAIYALLAIPLRSYLQPLIIMSVIPFGVVGAIFGHGVMNAGLSFMSMVGIVALSGVVVNASLVLVHYVNQRRAYGISPTGAVCDAAVARFRPIVLTSMTTFVGLTPLMLEQSVQAQFLIPMAISLAYGVLFATLVTLLVLPAGYLILEDLRTLLPGRRGRGQGGDDDATHPRPRPVRLPSQEVA